MSDTRSNGQAHRDAVAEQVTQAIGDGSAITADDFGRMGYLERSQLFTVNPDAYARLTSEQDRKVAGR